MRGSEHLAFAFLMAFPLIFLFNLPSQLFLFFIFLFLGALVPDVDEENSLIFKLTKSENSLGFLFGSYAYFLNKIVLPIISFFEPKAKQHRGLTHTLLFAIIHSFTWFAILYIITKNWSLAFAAFLGLFVGQISHIIGDSFTVSGTEPFYPKKLKLKGPFVTGKNSQIPVYLSIIPLFVFLVLYAKYNFLFAFVSYLVVWFALIRFFVEAVPAGGGSGITTHPDHGTAGKLKKKS